jgi:hypothetical protein
VARDLLSCEAAGTLAPGERRTFAMRLAVPASTAAGDAVLIWQLGERGPSTQKIPVTILPASPSP